MAAWSNRALKAKGAKRGKVVRNADAKTNIVPPPRSRFRQRSDCVLHFKCHQYGLRRWVLYWHRVIEDDHHAVISVPFQRAIVVDDDFADGRMVVASQGRHVFRVGALGEPGEPA